MFFVYVAIAAATGGLTPPLLAGSIRSSATIVHARQALDDTLVDYPHARFRNAHVIVLPQGVQGPDYTSAAGDEVVCGQINAPNKAGGMGGWTDIAVLPSTALHPVFMPDEADDGGTPLGRVLNLARFSTLCPSGSTAPMNATVGPADVSAALEFKGTGE